MNDNLAYRENRRVEKIAGEVVAMSPSPRWNHMAVSGNIYKIFANYLSGKKCTPIQDGFDLYLDDENQFVPDFMVVCDTDKIKPDGVHGAPDLVVEVLSPSTAKNDKGYKMEAYARFGVKEYWIVNPADKSVDIYTLKGSSFSLHDVLTVRPEWELNKMSEEERASLVTKFKCSLFDDLEISLEDIFYRTF